MKTRLFSLKASLPTGCPGRGRAAGTSPASRGEGGGSTDSGARWRRRLGAPARLPAAGSAQPGERVARVPRGVSRVGSVSCWCENGRRGAREDSRGSSACDFIRSSVRVWGPFRKERGTWGEIASRGVCEKVHAQYAERWSSLKRLPVRSLRHFGSAGLQFRSLSSRPGSVTNRETSFGGGGGEGEPSVHRWILCSNIV